MSPRRERATGEDGFTLTEVLVSMTVLTIFLAIFGGAMISMFQSVRSTEQTGYAAGQVNQVFARLDLQLRYSSGISAPISNKYESGDAVVEFQTTYTGTAVCTQLRLSAAGLLQERSWVPGNAPDAPRLLAADLTADTPRTPASTPAVVAGPFAVLAPVGILSNQQLEIAVSSRFLSRTSSTPSRVRQTDVIFVALNTAATLGEQPQSFCSEGRSYAWPGI